MFRYKSWWELNCLPEILTNLLCILKEQLGNITISAQKMIFLIEGWITNYVIFSNLEIGRNEYIICSVASCSWWVMTKIIFGGPGFPRNSRTSQENKVQRFCFKCKIKIFSCRNIFNILKMHKRKLNHRISI